MDGAIYVSDAFFNRVIAFDRAGRALRAYGKQGDGPGELRKAVIIVLPDDSTVAISDDGKRVLTLYGRADGRFRKSIPYDGILRSATYDSRDVWMGLLDIRNRTSVAKWVAGTDTFRKTVPMPAEYLRSEPLAGIYTGVSVVAWGDSLLIGFSGLNRLYLATSHGAVVRTVDVPVRRRRGVPPDVVRRLSPEGGLSFPQMFALSSFLFQLERRPARGFLLVHLDQEISGRLITARVFVSLLTGDLRRACVDAEVPVSADAQPVTAVRGDTLFIVQQMIAGNRAAEYLVRTLVSEEGCEWLATGLP